MVKFFKRLFCKHDYIARDGFYKGFPLHYECYSCHKKISARLLED